MASYCHIKSQSGLWTLRIDDIDGPRTVPGSAASIQRTLELYGFAWDGPVRWQSERSGLYQSAIATLVAKQLIFTCGCSRRLLVSGNIYPGTCRHNTLAFKSAKADYHRAEHALRCKLTGRTEFSDIVQGLQSVSLERDVGDIIVWRRDNLAAYALACAIDDAENVTHVVRGTDLLDSTPAQLAIMQALGLPAPQYAHIPVAIDASGNKLSKQSTAQALSSMDTLAALLKAWTFLGQSQLQPASIPDFWQQAFIQWRTSAVPCMPSLQL